MSRTNPPAIRPVRVNHMNVAVEDFDATVAHWRRLFDAEFFLDIPRPEWHAGLVQFGEVIFELFAPPYWLLNARYGPYHVGLEYQADMADVRAAVAARDMRIVRDIGEALHTHPQDGFGVSFEFYEGEFHTRDWPMVGGRIRAAAAWDSHPLGLTGLKGYSLAVHDIDAATTFLQSFLSGEIVYEEARPAIAARARGLRIGDAIVELQTPDGAGALVEHLYRWGDGIRSTVFSVRDSDAARRHFDDHGIAVESGALPDSILLSADANLGLIFEFAAD